jgi:DNA-binding NtrC family response regulator
MSATTSSRLDSDARAIVLVYSQRDELRSAVRSAVGRRPAADVPRIDWVECVNYSQVKDQLDSGDIDLAIFDGDAQPTGGVGLCRQFKNEITNCPPIMITLLRQVDRWLAAWSQADGVLLRPIDPVLAASSVADILRTRDSAIPLIR